MKSEELIKVLDNIKKIGIAIAKSNNYKNADNEFEYIRFCDNEFEVCFTIPSHCSCCSDDEYWYSVKLEDIDKDIDVIIEDIKIIKDEELRIYREKADIVRIELKKKQEEKEYNDYIKLKDKFEK